MGRAESWPAVILMVRVASLPYPSRGRRREVVRSIIYETLRLGAKQDRLNLGANVTQLITSQSG